MSVFDPVIPLAGMIFCAAVAVAAFYFHHRNRALRHQTIRLALEKGQPLPAELLHEPAGRRGGDLRTGVITTSLGLGLSAFLRSLDVHAWGVGLVLVSLGVGFLVAHWLAPNAPAPDAEKR